MLRVDRVGVLYRAKATKIGGMVATVSEFGGRSGHGARAAKAARFVSPPDSVAREELTAWGVTAQRSPFLCAEDRKSARGSRHDSRSFGNPGRRAGC
jgi:hypothetical protein